MVVANLIAEIFNFQGIGYGINSTRYLTTDPHSGTLSR